ncbi:MAG: CBS domain-containing protein [Rhodocyclaceae bacterium]|nr:CBS domain-containing protein [Rhodocyclaceae bacterium]
MKSVAQILRSKAVPGVATITQTASVHDAALQMGERGIGALLVMERDRIIGIVSERDLVRKLVQLDKSAKKTLVGEVMTSPVMYVEATQTNEECMALMTDNRLRHLPVLEGGKLVGLISIGDLVKDVISEQQFIIDQLEHYITGVHT